MIVFINILIFFYKYRESGKLQFILLNNFFICDNIRNVKSTNLSSSILAKFTAWIRNTAVTFPPFWLLFYARIVYHDAYTMYIPYLSHFNDSPRRRNFCLLPQRTSKRYSWSDL